MTSFVLDNSVVLAWCMADENHPLADYALRRATSGRAFVPGIWWYELRNALLVNERRGRLGIAETAATLGAVARLRVSIDADHHEQRVLDLARRCRLTVYDAAYLEVAIRRALPLASLDRRLRDAATASGVPLLSEPGA